MEQIGIYKQVTDFSTEHAGTAEWCKAEHNGRLFFVKKFQSPVYPSREIGLPEKMYLAGVAEFKQALSARKEIYRRLRECDQTGVLVIPEEVINYQFHICTVAEYITSNVSADEICRLSEWQRIILMRTLTLALMDIHKAGIVHSDMKPDNVLITQDSRGHCKLRLIDFDGSFPESDPPADAEEVVGDPAFFAPEAYRMSMDEDIRLDHRIDIFALGIIFHYFWCGKYPVRPEGQTIGECLLRGGSVTFDGTVPLVLQQLIKKMIAANPDDRLSLKSVYEVLGVQVEQYPSKIVNLQPRHAAETAVPSRSAARRSTTRTGTKEPETETRETEVRIEYVDDRGDVLRRRSIRVPYGTRKIIEAEEIPGYRRTSMRTKEISVDSKGYTTSPVTFTFKKAYTDEDTEKSEKPRKKRRIIPVLLFFLLLYWVVMYALSMNEYNAKQYDKAYTYMNATPFFSDLFKTEYQDARDRRSILAITPDQRITVTLQKENFCRYYSFTPAEAGYYSFYSTGDADTKAVLYDSGWHLIAEDGSSGAQKNFRIKQQLQKNRTYYLRVDIDSRSAKESYSLTVHKNE